jgi:hypothetical protein
MNQNIKNQFELFDKIPTKNNTTYNVLKHEYESSKLSDNFFSDKNINVINNSIIQNVKSISNYDIPPQNKTTILHYMRNIYIEHSSNLLNDIDKQVISLNRKVLEKCIPSIIESIKANSKYQYDISHMHMPMERGVATSKKGLVSNEFKGFFTPFPSQSQLYNGYPHQDSNTYTNITKK